MLSLVSFSICLVPTARKSFCFLRVLGRCLVGFSSKRCRFGTGCLFATRMFIFNATVSARPSSKKTCHNLVLAFLYYCFWSMSVVFSPESAKKLFVWWRSARSWRSSFHGVAFCCSLRQELWHAKVRIKPKVVAGCLLSCNGRSLPASLEVHIRPITVLGKTVQAIFLQQGLGFSF